MEEGLQVTWFPSYGPEMRGGTCNCTVIIADDEIGSPMVRNPLVVLAMNLPSLDKYETLLKTGGLLVINASMVNRDVKRTDIRIAKVPANAIAEKIGDRRMTNMVLLGSLLANLPIISMGALEKALKAHLPERHHHLIPRNMEALKLGAACKAENPA
jgi:2-oxoglutarate ferredoxin oxidoreductase subunit gamma